MKFYTIAHKKDGQFKYDVERIKSITSEFYEGKYLISFQRIDPKSDIKDYRRCYFSKLDALCPESGEDRYSMHDNIKEEVIEDMLAQLPQLFTLPVASTKYLTTTGWSILLERLDLWAFVTYGAILQ